jgi:hypothetical protein
MVMTVAMAENFFLPLGMSGIMESQQKQNILTDKWTSLADIIQRIKFGVLVL